LNGINIGLLATRKSRRTAVAFVMHAYIHTYLQRNLRLNSVARRRRDSSPREKKWFDAMCEEPFDAVAKVVVHSCGKLNVVLSVFVALTTNSIYIAVLLRPGTFPLCCSRCQQLQAALRISTKKTILFRGFVLILFLCCQALLVNGEVMHRPGAALAA